jgi:hypothetical protein
MYTWEAIVQHGADVPMEVSAREGKGFGKPPRKQRQHVSKIGS